MKRLLRVMLVSSFLIVPSLAAEESTHSISARFDCLHLFNADKGSNQNCLTVSSLKLRLTESTGKKTSAFIELDPFAGPDARRNRLPGKLFYAERSHSNLISDFGLLWTPRPSLLVKLGLYQGLVANELFSSNSSFEDTLLSGPWKQLALTIGYKLALFHSFDVEMTVGNGEGELYQNLDPQQYFSFLAKAELSPGLWAGFGVSLDGNNQGSQQLEWLQENLHNTCGSEGGELAASNKGFQTQRALLFLALDGKRPGWEGLRTTLTHRRVIKRDLDSSVFKPISNCKRDDWSWFTPDSSVEGASNSIEMQQNGIGLGYKILDTAEIGFNFATLTVLSTESGFLTPCAAIQAGICQQSGDLVDRADQTSYSVSLSFDLNEKLRLNTEYHARAYDRIYQQIYYLDRNNSGGKELDLFNAGFLYNFDR